MSDTPDLLEQQDNIPDDGLATENPLLSALDLTNDDEFRIRLEGLHPADFSDFLEELNDAQREVLVMRAPALITGELLAELEDDVVEDVLPLLEPELIADALNELDSDDVTQIMEEMEAGQREDVLEAMEPLERAGVEASLAFDDETIGRLMQREFVSAPEFWTVGDTIDHMRDAGEDLPELFFNIYIVDPRLKPIGYVPVSKLMRAPRDTTLASLMDLKVFTIAQDVDQEEAAYLFEKYHLISAPVVDTQGRMVGMMTVDDILDIIQDENKEDFLALAGVSDAGITDTAFSTVRARAPWLLVNLGTAILASIVIARFDYAIEQIVALAVLMPIVASMGGNAGTQALTVAVRGLAERDLTKATAWRAVRREGVSAMIIGIIFAFALAGISFVWFGDAKLAGVAFVAMIINHTFAGLAGILIPLGLKRAGADPAVSSSVFVTTVTDVVGFAAFLGFAAAVLL
ncbi:magnesium transporter MgtE [Algimonas ampicilliniresistens]|jgi:magnesium transporter|uniref:Magnesium transporter MgtE n=1 Tax=Algimonas ampicilliniresistens TaxID=1298735 RepID=A0ABQ5V7U0_9PROT|nr:magnesium transporter [Algimonas ampicilliniresistens]GLQ22730.1 magnesium transporter MgtE [Algimonas ampicilliniresistens]